jgi:uncharacterized secreted protein with C-terminal beta-propeller domain
MRKLKNEQYIVINIHAEPTKQQEFVDEWESVYVPEDVRKYIEKECRQ